MSISNPLIISSRRPLPTLLHLKRTYSTSPPPPTHPSPKFQKTFHGSVPSHPAHLILHSPAPSTEWTARWGPESYITRLTQHAKQYWGGTLVNLSRVPDDEDGPVPADKKVRREPDGLPDGTAGTIKATLYRPNQQPLHVGLFIYIPLPEFLADLTSTPPPSSMPVPTSGTTHIYVCTHANRDCRCGETGGAVFRALSELVREGKGDIGMKNVKVREISHVGGHVWAANVLTYPKGDWYGQITPADVPRLLQTILSPSPTIWAEKWRGRAGLTADEQWAVLAKAEAEAGPSAPLSIGSETEREPGSGSGLGPVEPNGAPTSPAPIPGTAVPSTSTASPTAPPRPSKSTIKTVPLAFQLSDGRVVNVDAPLGDSLMEVCKAQVERGGMGTGFDAVEGVCGGQLECATCHIYLPPSPPPTSKPAPVPPPTDSEEDMLAYAIGVREGVSRLGCQIEVTRKLANWCKSGGMVGVPRY